jgi:hypothetical protein
MVAVRSLLCAMMIFAVALFQVRADSVVLAEFPFEFREGLLWVQVAVPQSDKPLNFLLDTGAGASVINLNTARRLNLHLGKQVIVQGVEYTTKGFWSQRLFVKANGVQLQKNYLAVDLGKLGQACNCCVDGLIGADFFQGRVVQIDFDAQKIRILKSDDAEKFNEALLLKLRSCGMRVPITVNGHKRQWVRLDTGCASALQWVTSGVRLEQCAPKTAIGLTAISIPQTQTTVNIGKQAFEKVPTGLHETAIFPGEAGLLGNGLLSRFSTVTIDVKAGRVILEKHSSQE